MNFGILKDSKVRNSLTGILNSYGSTAAMAGGFIGFGFALWSAFKASQEVSKIHDEYDQKVEEIEAEEQEEAIKKQEKREAKTNRNIKYIMAYRWVILFGATGTGLMLLTKIMDGHAIATWAGIAATQKDKLEKFGESAKKVIGEDKYKEIEDKALENSIFQNFISNGEPFALELGNDDTIVFMEPSTNMIFPGTKASLTVALNKIKEASARNHGVQAVKVYEDVLGIDISNNQKAKDAHLKDLWWGPNNQFDWKFGERKAAGCIWQTVEWINQPTSGKAAGIPGFKY